MFHLVYVPHPSRTPVNRLDAEIFLVFQPPHQRTLSAGPTQRHFKTSEFFVIFYKPLSSFSMHCPQTKQIRDKYQTSQRAGRIRQQLPPCPSWSETWRNPTGQGHRAPGSSLSSPGFPPPSSSSILCWRWRWWWMQKKFRTSTLVAYSSSLSLGFLTWNISTLVFVIQGNVDIENPSRLVGFTLYSECVSVCPHLWHPSHSPFVSTIWCSRTYKPYIF